MTSGSVLGMAYSDGGIGMSGVTPPPPELLLEKPEQHSPAGAT